VAQRELTDVNVENLTDEQVQKAIDEMNNRGLTLEQAAQLARARGVSQTQIDQMTERMRRMQAQDPGQKKQKDLQSAEMTGPDALRPVSGDSSLQKDKLSVRKEDLKISEAGKKIFGVHIFNRENLSFEPAVNVPVPADYVLGIGDEIALEVWGASQQSDLLEIGNNGAVNISGIGPVKVAGLNYTTARDLIINRLTAIYSDMGGAHPGTFADVTVNHPRAIKVNVIGEAIAPGTYTLPAAASAFNALYLSGGPNENGSFREIRVMRDNRLFATIDVYDYLIHANTSANVSLRNQDILFIPTYHKRVETAGAFKRKAVFELKEDENLADLLNYCGGLNEKAAASRLLLTRFNNEQYQLIDVDQSQYGSFPLKNGDRIRAGEVIDRFENRLTIEGAVFRPGSYALDQDMTLSALIKKAGGLREDYFSGRGMIIRLDNQLYPTTIPFNVDEVMQGTNDLPLQREDQVILSDIFSMGEKKTVRISGEVIRPGHCDFHRNMTMKDLIFLSGGMTEAASESYVEVARRNSYGEAGQINSKMAALFQFNIDRQLKLDIQDAEFKLAPFDQVYIRKAPSYGVQKTVSVRGEVKFPGEYSISSKEERISDLVKRAGGVTPSAFVEGAKLRRTLDQQLKDQKEIIKNMKKSIDNTIRVDTTQMNARLELRLKSILENPGSSYDYFLREGDEVFVPMKTEEIWVNGEVLNPIGLAWEKGRGLGYYINRSGGFSPNAKKSKAYVMYSNGTTQVTRGMIFRHYPDIKPGSQIIIPSKPERRPNSTGNWLAITSAVSSLAIAAAALLK
ncbi:MAG: SLBB domain-containing protein, partial [Mangrovibacterium sp.]|nr:SLBB domain-containing protein [Mangrovibacterium sp.]